MTFFIISVIVFTFSIVALTVFLALWTYEDAKVKSTQSPVLWALVVLLVSQPLGLVIYLLVGRTNKDAPAPGKYKRAAIVSLVIFVISIPLFVGSLVNFVISENLNPSFSMNSGVTVLSSERTRSGSWTFTARSATATRSRTQSLRGADFDNFHVNASLESGSMYLRLTQGSVEQWININNYYGFVDLRSLGFEEGSIRKTLDMRQAARVNLAISWR